jgi:hypothetical protein
VPFLITMVRRYVLAAVALPLAAKALGALGRRVETARGPGHLSSVLQGGSRLISRRFDRTSTNRAGKH